MLAPEPMLPNLSGLSIGVGNDTSMQPSVAKKSKPNALPVTRMDGGKLALKPHQYAPALAVASHFEKPTSVAAGVLVYYEVGTGKTFAALHAARTFIDLTGGHVYIITTKANIESTWTRDWEVYKSALNESKQGASAPYTRALSWGTKDSLFKKETLKQPYMLVVDEAHLLRNLDSMSAPQVLDICAGAAYVMPLTATPIVRTVSNLDALYSYMMGEEERIVHVPTASQLENGDKITSAVEVGQYFKGMVLYEAQDTSHYPTVTETTVNVPLGDEYEVFVREDDEKLKALHEKIKSMKIGRERWNTTIARIGALGKEGVITNPFHVNSRQVCNSERKFQMIWDAIVADGDKSVVVFSNFRREGVDGFMEWIVQTQRFIRTGKRDYTYVIRRAQAPTNEPTYEVVLWDNEQYEAITKWQHKAEDNVVKVLLISPMAREGLSLKRVRQFHLMEPSWNISDETQAIGRAVRMTSHADLPLAQQTVHVRRWIATYEGGQTADERLAELAEMRANVIEPYLGRMRMLGTNYLQRLTERLSV